ncbi:MAG: extracellular solute-binding protein [Ruminococcaceae bacterium]|nr:extracellular solute-binding protein [Oscillospiraceae bacterium]
MLKKLFVLLLAVCLCLSVFACGGNETEKKYDDKDSTRAEDEEDKKDSSEDKNTNGEISIGGEMSFVDDVEDTSEEASDTVSSSENEGESGAYADLLPEAVDMGGRKFNILQRWFGYGKPTIDFQGEVIWEDSENGDMTSINLAKKKVLDEVQKKYNCTVTGEMSTKTAGEIRTMLQDDILAGTAEYDFCFETYYYYYAFAEDGLLTDLNDLGIDFSQAWWDQNAVEDLSVCGKLYYALGDINTYDNDGTSVLFFNKDLYERKGGDVQALYDMALAGDWTFEEFKNIVTGFGADLNADGKRDKSDLYGLLTERSNLYNHLLASGGRAVEKDDNDEPYYALLNKENYDVFVAATNLYLNSNDVFICDLDVYTMPYDGYNPHESNINAFKEGRGLFYMTSLIKFPCFSDMNDEFGVLPIPKYSTEQDRYYHHMLSFASSVLFVPNGENSRGEKGEELGVLLDALGAYSKDYVTPAYYEKLLKRGEHTDTHSGAVLENCILNSRRFDLGQVFDGRWMTADVIDAFESSWNNLFEERLEDIEENIASTVEKIKENG